MKNSSGVRNSGGSASSASSTLCQGEGMRQGSGKDVAQPCGDLLISTRSTRPEIRVPHCNDWVKTVKISDSLLAICVAICCRQYRFLQNELA